MKKLLLIAGIILLGLGCAPSSSDQNLTAPPEQVRPDISFKITIRPPN